MATGLNSGIRLMNPPSWFDAGGHSGVGEVLWQDDERVVCRAWRYGPDRNRRAVVNSRGRAPSARRPQSSDTRVRGRDSVDLGSSLWACQTRSWRRPKLLL
jgi:hypothetical protein